MVLRFLTTLRAESKYDLPKSVAICANEQEPGIFEGIATIRVEGETVRFSVRFSEEWFTELQWGATQPLWGRPADETYCLRFIVGDVEGVVVQSLQSFANVDALLASL